MNTITQDNFIGGMTALFDSTKTPNTAYRAGLNCRARKNGITGAFKPVKINTPVGVHQAIFTLDTHVCVVIGGLPYRYLVDSNTVIPISGYGNLDDEVDWVYHENVPVPTNLYVGPDSVYQPTIASLIEAAVLQDGSSTPLGVLGNMSRRTAGTFASWKFELPEYIPVGKQMAHSGKKLYVVSPDGKKIYQSKTGRAIDFVLDFDESGNKRGDAAATSLAVAANALVALHPSQTGGLLAATGSATHSAEPDFNFPLEFNEPYIRVGTLFPVGAVSHLGLTNALGETVFVAPGGIQSFNETAQQLSESNNTPFGAPIVDYLVRPITRACTARADNYTFFGLDTIFGSGILVFDNQLGTFVSIDLVGAVKEFAVLNYSGVSRVFFITYSDEMYEYPLYAGEKSTAHVYFGEYAAEPTKAYKPLRAVLSFNNIRSSGVVSAEFFVNRLLRDVQTRTLEPQDSTPPAAKTTPVMFPTEGETETQSLAFSNTAKTYGTSLGLQISLPADATLTALSVEVEGQERSNLPAEEATEDVDNLVVMGDIRPDSEQDAQRAEVTEGRPYYFYAPTSGLGLLNGGESLTSVGEHTTKRFVAKADTTYGSATAKVYDFSSFERLLATGHTPVLLGGLGRTDRISPILASLASKGGSFHALLGPWEFNDLDRTAYALSFLGTTRFAVHETDRVRMFFLSFPLSETASVVNSSTGALTTTPDEMLEDGEWHGRIEQAIAEGDEKFNIIFSSHSPYANGDNAPGVAAFRWNFKRLGVHAVISANTNSYYRTYVNGVHFATPGTANDIYGFAALRMRIGRSSIKAEFRDIDGKIRDQFFAAL